MLSHVSALLILIQALCCRAYEIEIGSGSGLGRICNGSSVRLVNGSAPSNGRLEVCHDGAWGTVCNVSFFYSSGNVVCKQLGFFGVASLTNEFGPGTGDIVWLGDLDCQGTEKSLSDCTHVEFFSGPYNCQPCHHYRDVGLVCSPHEDACEDDSVRLIDRWIGPGNYNRDNISVQPYGHIELCMKGLWGIITVKSFDYYRHDASNIGRVVCRQLGYSNFIDFFDEPLNFLRFEFSLSFVGNCYGNETRLYDCAPDDQGQLLIDHQGISVFDTSALFITCHDDIDLQLLTNSTTIVLGPDRIEETVNFTCHIEVTVLSSGQYFYYDLRNLALWFFEDRELQESDDDHYSIAYPDRELLVFGNSFNVSSTLQIINPRRTDAGIYHCSVEIMYRDVTPFANYEFESFNQTHYLELEADLSLSMEVLANSVLSCELTGYIFSNTTDTINVEWFRDGDPIQTIDGQYNVTVSNNSDNVLVTGEGIRVPSIISTLHIYTKDVGGDYNCTVFDGNSGVLYENFTLRNEKAILTDSSTTTSTSTSTTTTTTTTSAATVTDSTTTIVTSVPLTIDSIAGITVGTVIFISLICCLPIIIACVLRQRKSKKIKLEALQHTLFVNQQGHNWHRVDTSIQRKKLNELHLSSCVIDSSDLKLMEKIGQGEFGVVYRGVYTAKSSVMSVAIKTVKGLYTDSQKVDDLLVEADKMKSFDHLHVLSLTGICVGLLESPCIVMPFMSNGSLLSYLRREAADLTISEMADENIFNSILKHLLSICLQVAKGMDYLAQQKFIHRDLAARNCMISSEGIIKIADFGLSEDVYTTVYFKRTDQSSDKLPLKWMALESIHLGKYDEKTDVWSYGVLCWEVFNGGKTPYPGSTPKEVVTMLDNGERLAKPTNAACTEEVYSIMMSCWDHSPECRPHFFNLVETINGLLVPLADYMDLASDYLKFN